mmetsp:Transcript_20944/g.61973  ORF Transcript_20944/g.61973 Transcript_20944/m.61973 type:complete len:307 (+) Transcript_20944:644-1564(+)
MCVDDFVGGLQRCHACVLRDGARARRDLALQLRCCFHDRRRGRQVAEAIARHCIGLGEAIDGEGPVAHAFESRKGHMRYVIRDPLVYFVGEHEDVRELWAPKERSHVFQKLPGDRGPRGVRRVAYDEHARPRREHRRKLVYAGHVVVSRLCLENHGRRAGEAHDVRIGRIVRCRDDDFIACCAQCHHGLVDGLLAAAGDHYLILRVRSALLACEVIADGAAELEGARERGVARETLVGGLSGGINDRLRRGKVRLTHTESGIHLLASRFHVRGQAEDGDRLRGRHGRDRGTDGVVGARVHALRVYC